MDRVCLLRLHPAELSCCGIDRVCLLRLHPNQTKLGGVGKVCRLRIYPDRIESWWYRQGMPGKASSKPNQVVQCPQGMPIKASSRPNWVWGIGRVCLSGLHPGQTKLGGVGRLCRLRLHPKRTESSSCRLARFIIHLWCECLSTINGPWCRSAHWWGSWHVQLSIEKIHHPLMGP